MAPHAVVADAEDPFRDVIPLPDPENPDDDAESGKSSSSFDVVVAGAGPVGLLLGCYLRLVGANVALVDPHLHSGGSGSKAALTMPRTLEVLSRVAGPPQPQSLPGTDDHDDVDLASGGDDGATSTIDTAATLLLAAGARPVRQARFAADGSWLGDVTGFSTDKSGCRFPPVTVGQDVLETILARRYEELGGVIFRAARVTSVEEGAGGVAVGVKRDVYVRPPDAPPELPPRLAKTLQETSLSARYVVGADGRNSAVRDILGIEYEGQDYDQVFFLADVEVEEGELERCGWDGHGANVIVDASGALVLFVRIQGNAFRTYYCAADLDPKECTEDFLRSTWDEKIPGGGFECAIRRFETPTAFRISCRLASRFSSDGGRVYLAGDAAHCHSPAGGQGMNTGVQDAANLAWKLGAALRMGEGDEASSDDGDSTRRRAARLLASYEAERRPVAEWVLNTTDAGFRSATTPSSWPLLNGLRNLLARFVLALAPQGSIPPAAVRDKGFGLSLSYRDVGNCVDAGARPPSGALVAGDRLPDLPLRRLAERTTPAAVADGSDNGNIGYLHDLLGPLSTRLALVVVSGGEGAEVEKEDGAGAVARTVEACAAAAAKLGNISNAVLVVHAASVAAVPQSTKRDQIRVDRFVAVEGEVNNSERGRKYPATLAGRLRLGSNDVAIVVARPDTYVALVHRGVCDAATFKASLERHYSVGD